MTYDSPYRVRLERHTSNGHSSVKRYTIERSGFDVMCYCNDVTYAYRLVDLLNTEERNNEKRTAAADRRIHQGGTGEGLADPAA